MTLVNEDLQEYRLEELREIYRDHYKEKRLK